MSKKGLYKLDGKVVSEEEYYEAIKPEKIFNITHDYDYDDGYNDQDTDEYYDVYEEIYSDDNFYEDMREAEEAHRQAEYDRDGFYLQMLMEMEDY